MCSVRTLNKNLYLARDKVVIYALTKGLSSAAFDNNVEPKFNNPKK